MEWQVGQWVEVVDGMSGYLRVGDVYQVERITDQATIGLKGKKDCWAFERFKPFVWQVGKTYRTTLEGVTATITQEAGENHIRGTAKHLKPDAVLGWTWNSRTGLVNNFADDPDVPHLLPFLADEPSEPEPTLTERYTVGQLGTLWGVFDRLTNQFARCENRELSEVMLRDIGSQELDLDWWQVTEADLPGESGSALTERYTLDHDGGPWWLLRDNQRGKVLKFASRDRAENALELAKSGEGLLGWKAEEVQERDEPAPVAQPKSRYHRTIKGVTIDLYDLAEAYGIKDHAQFHAMKKIIMAGDRGYKDRDQDLQEAIASIERARELAKGGAE